jgi:hypothetical protein
MFVGEETPEEAGVYRDNQISVDPLQVTPVQGKPIAVANVAAARVVVAAGSRAPGIAVAVMGSLLGGACLLAGSEGSQTVALLFMAGCVAIGAMMAVTAQDRYTVQVELVGGKTRKLFETRDRAQADAAVRAINRAAGRGR